MWQAETFDPDTIDRELGWAAGLGMNAIRVYLHDLVFDADGDAFLGRVDRVLDIAGRHGIAAIPVLFDGVWNPSPRLGPQPEPRPRVHNSIWVQGPGSEVLHDRSAWPRLHSYVTAVLQRFGTDRRVLAWDLFNEPDQIDLRTLAAGSNADKARAATELLAEVFDRARELDPAQPLTAGIWEYDAHHRPVVNDLNTLILERSDIITFHCYAPADALIATIGHLSAHDRPLVCTEWLARTVGSTVDLLEVFAEHDVGAINWGLVDGRTQTRYPWRSWNEPVDDAEPWFHELLHPAGSPYDDGEAATFRRLTDTRRRRDQRPAPR